jgi:hypothetical protein
MAETVTGLTSTDRVGPLLVLVEPGGISVPELAPLCPRYRLHRCPASQSSRQGEKP